MIKKGDLPECVSGFGAEMERGFVFERFYKAPEVRRWGITLQQQMQVVGHQAVSAQGEGLLSGNLKEVFHEPSRDAWRTEIGDAIACAESEKVGSAADIVLFWEADGFVESLWFEGRGHGGLPVVEYTVWL
ncbi:MAG TPA: hypothetical protein VNU20_04265 [Candidatus Sulfotelmatobacter sp.]|nr:hypothetical protein [Candidatus Sulfotelmatobacter sp.]